MCSNWCLALHIFCMIWCYLSHFCSLLSRLSIVLLVKNTAVWSAEKCGAKWNNWNGLWSLGNLPRQIFVLPVWLFLRFKLVGIFAHHRKLHSESLDTWLLPQHVGRLNFQHRPNLSRNYRSWPVVFTYLDGFVVCLSTKSRNGQQRTANVFTWDS